MVKKKTLKEQSFTLSKLRKMKLKTGEKVETYDPGERFRDAKKVYLALIDALKEGDASGFKEILAAYLEVVNKDEFAKRSGLSRRTLFRMLSASGNPTLDNITRIVSALKK
jgi:probable addiction module antidote protein